jgi:hypothetical protein
MARMEPSMSRQQNTTCRPARARVAVAFAASLALAGAGGSALAGTRPPVRKLPLVRVGVWAGRRLIIHGDYPGVTFSYQPGSNRWARLRPGPKPSTVKATDVAVWTGSRMLVMGLTNGSYNPVTNTWHRIARLSEKNGVWGQAIDVAAGERFAGLNAVSCGSPGNCAAGGFYSNDSGDIVQGLVVVERHGSWGGQIDVPGLRALNQGDYAEVILMSCAPAGGCAAAGTYTDSRGHSHWFVVSQTG